MNLPLELLPVKNVLVDLDVSNKKRLFEEVAEMFSNNYHIDRDNIFQIFLSREKLGSTGLGCGVAIPHGRMPNISSAIASFVRLKNPIDFDSPDGKPVSLIFLLLAPEDNNNKHLKILSYLAHKFSDQEIRAKLTTLPFAEDIVNVILQD